MGRLLEVQPVIYARDSGPRLIARGDVNLEVGLHLWRMKLVAGGAQLARNSFSARAAARHFPWQIRMHLTHPALAATVGTWVQRVYRLAPQLDEIREVDRVSGSSSSLIRIASRAIRASCASDRAPQRHHLLWL